MPEFLPALNLADLPPGKGETVLLNGQRVAVFHVGEKFFALADDCPHRGGPLAPGWIDEAQCHVACPLHGWQFDLATGACLTVPARPVKSFPVRVVDGCVEVALGAARVSF